MGSASVFCCIFRKLREIFWKSRRVRLHGQADPSKLPAFRVLPMNLPRGDVLTDEISEWRVIIGRL